MWVARITDHRLRFGTSVPSRRPVPQQVPR